jgi:hypothetical protein
VRRLHLEAWSELAIQEAKREGSVAAYLMQSHSASIEEPSVSSVMRSHIPIPTPSVLSSEKPTADLRSSRIGLTP